ncbi:MAG: hypothetical protein IKS41_03280 [Alphaproteobacteria bacterium]|nr:hypothetical protein [Alphaproteobacteria bacterium]
MDFSNFFRQQHPDDRVQEDTSAPEIRRLFSLLPTASIKSPLSGLLTSSTKPDDDLHYLHKIPLPERMRRLVDTGLYQRAYRAMFDREIQHIKRKELERFKKAHPEMANKVGMKNVCFEEKALDQIRNELAGIILDAIFEKKEIKSAVFHLLDPKAQLTKTDIDVLKVCIFVRKHDLDFLAKTYGLRTGVFQSIIAKGATDLADMMGEALKHDPRSIVGYGVECCRSVKGYNRGEVALTADQWVARWLDPQMLRGLTQAKKITPLEGTKTKKPTKEDIRWAQRYQASFKNTLLYYFYKSPAQAQNVFRAVLPYLPKMDYGMQEQMWGILFHKYKISPDIQSDIIRHISSFLEQCSSPETQRIMYSQFIKVVPASQRAELLGHLPPKVLRRYKTAFAKTYKSVFYAPIQTEEGPTHMAWQLFYNGELTDDQMKDILKKANPRTQRDFLFSPKKRMDRDLFSCMCERYADSPFYFWQWVRSFRSASDFKGSLAQIYLTLPTSIKDNKPYVSAMNNHYDLVRRCAFAGDTASLSALKKVLGPDVFWESLTYETEGQVSGVRSLCRQGKRGLLKLMADWPNAKQQDLFMTADASGRTLWDECTGNLARLVAQDVFKRPYQKPPEPVEQPSQEQDATETPSKETQKKTVQRQIIRLPAFEGHMAKIANNTKLVQEVEEAILALSRMTKAEMSAELRIGWKHYGNLDKTPCAVKDIRGNNYRLGYLPDGNVDQGTGQIAILFFLTHAQYDIFLNKQADQAVRTARTMLRVARQSFITPPTGPAGGNERQ